MDTIRPWDVESEPVGRAPIQMPTSPVELLAATERVMAQIAPDFGSLLGLMQKEGLIEAELQRLDQE